MLLFDYKIPVEADRALRDAYVALAFAFRRLEGSARSRDTELCSTLLKVRAEIERVLKAQDAAPAEDLAAPSASQEALREARELLRRGRQKLATYTDIYAGDKELRRLLADWDAALAQSAPVKGGE